MTQSWDIECTYIHMDIQDLIHNMTSTQVWVQQRSWIQWNLHKVSKYFNRINFREIKFREVKNSRNFLDLISRMADFKNFAWI